MQEDAAREVFVAFHGDYEQTRLVGVYSSAARAMEEAPEDRTSSFAVYAVTLDVDTFRQRRLVHAQADGDTGGCGRP